MAAATHFTNKLKDILAIKKLFSPESFDNHAITMYPAARFFPNLIAQSTVSRQWVQALTLKESKAQLATLKGSGVISKLQEIQEKAEQYQSTYSLPFVYYFGSG